MGLTAEACFFPPIFFLDDWSLTFLINIEPRVSIFFFSPCHIMASYIKVLWHLMEKSGLYWALWTAAGVQSRGSGLSSGNTAATVYSHPRCTVYFYSLEISPHKLIINWFIKFRHTWIMFANLLKETKHPTLLHIEYLVLRTRSEKCSKLKGNKVVFKKVSRKCSGRVLT